MDEISRSKDKENVVGCYTAVRFKTLFNRHSLVNYWIVKLIKGITCQGCISSNSNGANDRFRNDCRATVSDDFCDKFLSRCEDGTLNCVSSFSQAHTTTCCSSLGLFSPSKSSCGGNKIEMDHTLDSSSGDRSARHSVDFCCSSTSISVDVTGDGSTSETLSFRADDIPGSSAGSSPLAWPMRKAEDVNCDTPTMPMTLSSKSDHESVTWEEKKQPHISEMELMKERFAKLLLGEDMSGGGKGVCSALAISNAITNLSATVFGELWRLEPLALERRMMWKREMDWLLSVSDYIVELIPGVQNFPDGSSLEIMVSRPRSDLHINLPALRKLDTMLLEILESFKDTEFWYVDQGIYLADKEGCGGAKRLPQRHEDKWWLPIPRVPSGALTDMARKKLQHQRDCTNQILKAAMSINNNVLSEMEVPDAYLEALPKNGRASLGDIIYRYITAEQFSPDCLLDCLDLSSEHHTLEIANRIEAAIYVWRRRSVSKQCNGKENRPNMKSSWGIVKDLMGDADKREFLADRAESLLLSLKQRFPGLSQTALDMSKIQYNKDVGQSLLESYSRVLESLAFNIMARIDDLLYVDDFAKHSDPTQFSPIPPSVSSRGSSAKKTTTPSVIPVATGTPYASAFTTPNFSPNKAGRPGFLSNKIHSSHLAPIKVLSDYLDGDETKPTEEKENPKEPTLTSLPSSNERGKFWAYPENLGSRKGLM